MKTTMKHITTQRIKTKLITSTLLQRALAYKNKISPPEYGHHHIRMDIDSQQ